MGHYASEMDSSWGPSIDHTEKVMKLRAKISPLKLGDFKAGQLVLLHRLFKDSASSLNDQEIRELEVMVKLIARKNKRVRQSC